MKIVKKWIVFCFLFIALSLHAEPAAPQKIDELTFTQTDITSVLKIVGEIFKITIVPDKEVQGTVTRYFHNTTLEETLALLLDPVGFTYRAENGIYYVMKKPSFKVAYDQPSGIYQLEADNASLQAIINEISTASKETILYKGNGNDRITIRVYNKTLNSLLQLLAKSAEYEVTQNDSSYLFQKKETPLPMAGGDPGKNSKIVIEGELDNLSVKLANQSTKDIILLLFAKYNLELTLLSNSTATIPYLDIKGVTFDSLLTMLCEYGGQSFTVGDARYIIYDSISPRMINRYRQSYTYQLKNISGKNFQTMIPGHVIPPSSYKVDDQLNTVTLYGSKNEIDYFIDILNKTEESLASYKYVFFQLKFRSVKDIKNLLPDKYKNIQIQILEDTNTFYTYINQQGEEELRGFLAGVDTSPDEFVYKFKFLKPEDVIKSMLPEYVEKKNLYVNENNSSVVLRGNKDIKDKLFGYFDTIDVAPPVIRYQLLIVEYIKINTFTWNWGLGFQPMTDGISSMFSVEKAEAFNSSDMLNVNFDIPTVFGYYFSAFLEEQLYESNAKIQMSTEVYGLSGETVTITNTKTLQYKDSKTDDDGNAVTYYNSTTFGLNLEIKGRSTSSNEIFMEISTKISDEIESDDEDAAPNTSEKTVKNTIRSQSGKPIILGGLSSKKENTSGNVIPGLGNIPYLGEAFRTHDDSSTDSEFVIYVIPFINKTDDDIKKEQDQYIGKLYTRFIKRS